MRRALILSLFLAGCAPQPPRSPVYDAPDAVWQEGPNGWVYGPSPLHLWPAGLFSEEVIRIPDRIYFDEDSAVLDLDGQQLALVQGQRLRQLPDHDVTLFCGWSFTEEVTLGEPAAQALAAQRCATVISIYKELGLSTASLALRQVSPQHAAKAVDDALRRSVSIAVVTSGQTSHHAALPELYLLSDPMPGRANTVWNEWNIFLPDMVFFKREEADLSENSKSVLRLFADAILPSDQYVLSPSCAETAAEGSPDPEDVSLARERCDAVRSFLIEQGLCADRVYVSRKAYAHVAYESKHKPLLEIEAILEVDDFRMPGPSRRDEKFEC